MFPLKTTKTIAIELCKGLSNPLSANPTKWSNTLKTLKTCLSVFDHFVGLTLKGLRSVPTYLNYIVGKKYDL